MYYLIKFLVQIFQNLNRSKQTVLATASTSSQPEVTSVCVSPKEPSADLHNSLKAYLFSLYDFRYNLLTDQVEGRRHNADCRDFQLIDRRAMNTMTIEARDKGLNCWDRDVERLLKSQFVDNYHPIRHYMDHLPLWDGQDRITPLALRVNDAPLWIDGFRRWLLALTAQWMGHNSRCANSLVPLLISPQQGMNKSTFCRLLMPPVLANYYIDKFDFNAQANIEGKLGQFGLINLDEFDRYSTTAIATLKNLVQLKRLTVKKAYASYYLQLHRIASFIGTSNQTELLNDPSGSRRFLCVEVTHPIDCSPIDHDQLFAQLKTMIDRGTRVWMNREEEAELQRHNLHFMRLHPEAEVFHQIYALPQNNDEGELFTTSEILRTLCHHNSSAMRGINVRQLGRTLSSIGLQRIHTSMGTKYRLIKK